MPCRGRRRRFGGRRGGGRARGVPGRGGGDGVEDVLLLNLRRVRGLWSRLHYLLRVRRGEELQKEIDPHCILTAVTESGAKEVSAIEISNFPRLKLKIEMS